jgi:FkbM family methyltransferase
VSVPNGIYSSWPLSLEEGLHAKHLGREMTTEMAQAKSRQHSSRARRPQVQLVKLDVDGFECDVLRGATSLLRDTSPIFVMELRRIRLRSAAPP